MRHRLAIAAFLVAAVATPAAAQQDIAQHAGGRASPIWRCSRDDPSGWIPTKAPGSLEMWSMAKGGMAPHDVLQAATIFGAEGIGLQRDVGSLEAGKLADLVVLDGNPLQDIRNTNTVLYVMKNGRLYDGNTLDALYPRKRVMEPVKGTPATPDVHAGTGAP